MSQVSEQELLNVFAATLSPSKDERQAAEQRLAQVQTDDPSCFVSLLNIMLTDGYPVELRQAAAVSLRPLILRKWSPFFEKYEGYGANRDALALDIKQGVRQGLLQALMSSERKIRLAASNSLAAIASPDFPDEFPELLPFLVSHLQVDTANVDAVHGSMVFLSDFVRAELDENQLMSVAQEILPSLEALFVDEQRYSPHLRARSIMLFRQLLETLYMVKEQFPQAAKQAVDSLLPRWLQAMGSLLSAGLEAPLDQLTGSAGNKQVAWELLALRYEALTTLNMASHFKSHIKPQLAGIISTALRTIQAFLPAFQAFHVNASAGEEPFSEPPSFPPEGDADIAASIPKVLSAAVELIRTLVRISGAQGKSILQSAEASGQVSILGQLTAHLFELGQMTKDEEEEWTVDVNLFIAEQEDEDMGGGMRSESLRIVSIDALNEFLEILPPEAALPSVHRAFEHQLSSAQQKREQGAQEWWRPIEAALAIVGGNASVLGELLDPNSGSSSLRSLFQMEAIFEHSVIPYIAPGAPAFLRGQAFIFASHFSSLLPAHIARQFLDEAVKALEADATDGESMIVTVSSIRAIKNLHKHLGKDVVQGYAQRVLARIGPMLDVLQGDAIVLLLETIQSVVVQSSQEQPSTQEISDEVYGNITSVSLACYMKEPNDIILADVVQDLLEALAGRVSTSVGVIVLQAAVPQLASVLVPQEVSTAVGKPLTPAEAASHSVSAMETLAAVLRGAGAESVQTSGVTTGILPRLFLGIESSPDDRELLQSAVTALTLLVTKAPKQVFQWQGEGGTTAWPQLMSVIGRLLDPQDENENGGLVLGGLVLSLLRKAGSQLQTHLQELIQAMVTRLASAKTMSLAHSLILPIAHLMCDQCATVLQTLKSIQVGSEDGLTVFARRWAEETSTIHGAWAKKTNAVALSHLLESGDPLLQGLQVKGDLIPDNSGTIITRSKAKSRPDQYTQVPLGVKVLKLLLEEWSAAGDGEAPASSSSNAYDENDDEWDDEDDGEQGGALLSDMLGFDLDELVGSEDPFTGLTSEELKVDPINNLNLRSYISELLQRQASSPAAAAFASQLDGSSASTLQKAVTNA